MKTLFQLIAVATMLIVTASARAGEHPAPGKPDEGLETGRLDGQVFTGEMGKKGADTGIEDTLIFSKGTFVSVQFEAHGFRTAPYETHEIDKVITFTAKPQNEAGETMAWIGSVSDGTIEATVIHKTETEQTEYWFRGSIKVEKPKPPVLKPYQPE